MIRRPSTVPPIISASSAYYLAHGLIIVGGLISMPAMTRLLSKAEYGLLGLLYPTLSVLAVIAGLGLGESALRLYGEQRAHGAAAERDLCNTLLGGSLVAGGLSAILIAVGAKGLGDSRLMECLPLASILIAIRVVSTVLFQIYRAQERAFAHAYTQIFHRYGTMAVAIPFLLIFPRNAETVIAAAIVIELIAVVVRWVDLERRGTISMPALSRPILAAAMVYGLPLALAGLARFLLGYSDRYLIERIIGLNDPILGLDAVAMYSVPSDMTAKLGETLWTPILLAAMPIMFRLWESEGAQATSRFGSNILTYMVAIMVPIATFFVIHSEQIIVLLASAKYAGAGGLVPYLLPGALLGSINSIAAAGLTVQKRTTTFALMVLGTALFNILLNLILIPRWHLVGAAVSATLAQAALLAATRFAGRTLALKLHPAPILKAVVATIPPVLVLYGLGRVPSTSMAMLAVNLVFGVGATTLIFIALDARVRQLVWLGSDFLGWSGDQAERPSSDRRVLMIARDFPPALTSATLRTASFARHLPAFGWKVSVVTIADSFHAVTDPGGAPSLPEGCEVFHAFGFDTKAVIGVRGRYPSLLAFPDREVSWIFDGVRQALRAHRRGAADVVWSTSPSVSAHCIAYVVAQLTGLPWIAELRDPWNLDAPYGSLLRSADSRLQRRLLAAADAIVVTTAGLATDLERRCGASVRGKLSVISNGYEEESFAEVSANDRAASFSIAHIGECPPSYRDPAGFLRAVRRCIERGDLPPDTRIDFIGAAATRDSIWPDVVSSGLQGQVRITERLNRDDAAAVTARTPLLLLLQAGLDRDAQVPAKAYEYLRSGAYILAVTSPEGETAQLLRGFAGVSVVAPDDIDAIAAALAGAYRSWADGHADGYARDVQRYARAKLAGDLAQVLEAVRRRALGVA